MLEYNEVHKELAKSIEDFVEKLEESKQRMETLSSSILQTSELSNQVSAFHKEVKVEAEKLIRAEQIENVNNLLMAGFDQLVDFITDKPTVLQFLLEKEAEIQSVLSFSINKTQESLDTLKSKDAINESIEKELLGGENPEKRKAGKRPHKISDVRKVKSRLKKNDDSKNPEE